MSFSFCFSPMRRATLCAMASSFLGSGGKPLFWQLWHSLQAMPFSFLVFVIVAAGNALLIFGFCGIRCRQCSSHFWLCGIRYRRGPSMVRNMRAVLKKASWGTRRIILRHWCKKTGVFGTEGIFGAQNSLLWYATHFHQGYSVPGPITETTQKRTNLATCPFLVAGAGLEPTTSGL